MARRSLAEAKKKHSRRGALLAAAVLGGAHAGALAQSPVLIDVGRCVELPSPQDRFACYEAQSRAAREKDTARVAPSITAPQAADTEPTTVAPPPNDAAPAPASSRVAPTTAPPAPPAPAAPAARAVTIEPATPAAESAHRSRKAEPRSASPTADDPERVATIVDLKERLPSQWVITLDNGEVWLQTRPEIYRLRVGDEIRLRATHWGDSRQLTAANLRGFILVKRVQ